MVDACGVVFTGVVGILCTVSGLAYPFIIAAIVLSPLCRFTPKRFAAMDTDCYAILQSYFTGWADSRTPLLGCDVDDSTDLMIMRPQGRNV